MLMMRADQEHRLKLHSCTHTKNKMLVAADSAFSINFEKSWKGDVTAFDDPLSRIENDTDPRETARLAGFADFLALSSIILIFLDF
jgi:hypothetical protein